MTQEQKLKAFNSWYQSFQSKEHPGIVDLLDAWKGAIAFMELRECNDCKYIHETVAQKQYCNHEKAPAWLFVSKDFCCRYWEPK